ncbi:MAG TPA: DUF6318 family protein, partial [Modestobacter sp.]|nr:DUF6318 family protein [Modestobacter sp.]
MRLARVAAGALVVGAVLTGCSGKQPANDTLPSAAPTSAESSESLPPLGPPDLPMPTEAREPTSEAASAFVVYYMTVYNEAQQTMDAQYLRDLSKGCTTCDRIAEEIIVDSQSGFSYQGGQVTIDSISAPAVNGQRAEAAFSTTQAPLTVLDATGEA